MKAQAFYLCTVDQAGRVIARFERRTWWGIARLAELHPDLFIVGAWSVTEERAEDHGSVYFFDVNGAKSKPRSKRKTTQMVRKNELGTDSEGRYRRYLGYKQGNGKLVQHLFRLGRDRVQALERNGRLEALWRCVETKWRKLQAEGKAEDPCPLWCDLTLHIGMEIAKGEQVVTVQVPEPMQSFLDLQPTMASDWLARIQAVYPCVPLRLPEPEHKAALDKHEEIGQTLIGIGARELEAAQRLKGIPGAAGGLHSALDAYGDWVSRTCLDAPHSGQTEPTISEYGLTVLRQIKSLKEHHRDIPLARFDLLAIEDQINYWKNRPASKWGKPVARTTARNTIKLIRRFIRWLHRNPAFDWRKPEDLEFTHVRIPITPQEQAAKFSPVQVSIYTSDELAILFEYAHPVERLLMLVGLNCGFYNWEAGTLPATAVHLNEVHPYYKTLPVGSYVKKPRRKTGVYGEWKLWPLTVAGIEWASKRRTHPEIPELIQLKDNPYLKRTKSGNRSCRVANDWNRLIGRVQQDHPEFRRLPFSCLRDTGATRIRELAGGEIAEMYLCHGQVCADDLMEVYSNRHFPKLFAALDTWGLEIMPLFAAVKDPFPADYNRPGRRKSIGVQKRVKRLRAQGYKIKTIAAMVGCHEQTVAKWLRI